MDEKLQRYFIKHANEVYTDQVNDYVFFAGHLIYAVDCSIYRDNHKVVELEKFYEGDLITKLAIVDNKLLVGMDNGFIHIYNHEMKCVSKTKIYDFNADKEKFTTFIDDIELDVERNIIVINLNTRKEYYQLSEFQLLKLNLNNLDINFNSKKLMSKISLYKGDVHESILCDIRQKLEEFVADYKLIVGNESALSTILTVKIDYTRNNQEVCEKFCDDEKNFSYSLNGETKKISCFFKFKAFNYESTGSSIQIYEDGEPSLQNKTSV